MTRERPLAGVRVVVTRAATQAGPLIDAFTAAGAEVASLPLLTVTPPADPGPLETVLAARDRYDLLVFSSANAARAVLERVGASGLPPIAVIGPATAAAVRAAGGRVACEALRRDAVGLARALTARVAGGSRVLLPQADDARDELAIGLRQAGATVDTVVAYSKRLPAGARVAARKLFSDRPIGWVTFTSPRIVRHFVEVIGDAWPARRSELRAAAIGKTTAATLERHRVRPTVAREPTPGALVRAVARAREAWS